jgi:5-methyltetrahydrofolate--homocysteine methyltransferase
VVFADHSIADVEPYINWTMFYAAWQVRGNEQKEQLRADAEALLARIKAEKILRLEGVVGIFPARRGRPSHPPGCTCGCEPRGHERHANGGATVPESFDDIFVTDPRGREIRLPQLRSQEPGKPESLSLADYVADDGTPDWIGAFALTAGVGLREFTETLRAAGDDYNAIMAKLLADRLTEAFAEAVHEFIRRVTWGYQRDEKGEPTEIAPREAIHGKYRGLRFAFGYPATPDHSLKREVFALLGVEQTTAMRLTESCMIEPGEALCGLVVADSDARYFTLGTITDDQIADYARRRGTTPDAIRKLIGDK